MRVPLVVALVVCCLVGCAGDDAFRPNSPHIHLKPLVETAKRVDSPEALRKCGASEIGLIDLTGARSQVTEEVAELAAEHGGTHFFLGAPMDTVVYEGTRKLGGWTVKADHTERRVRALVYRLDVDQWGCMNDGAVASNR